MNLWNAGQLVLWLVVLFNLLLTVALARRLHALGRTGPGRPADIGLPAGTPAPDFAVRDLDGRDVRLRDLQPAPVVLGFFSPGCGACEEQAGDFAALARRAGAEAIPVLSVVDGDAETAAPLAARLAGASRVVLAPRPANPLMKEYAIDAYPWYSVVGADGLIAGSFGSVPELDRWVSGAGAGQTS